jgi:hypothetical protein
MVLIVKKKATPARVLPPLPAARPAHLQRVARPADPHTDLCPRLCFVRPNPPSQGKRAATDPHPNSCVLSAGADQSLLRNVGRSCPEEGGTLSLFALY